MVTNDQRGTALVESLPVMGLLAILIAGLLMAFYLLFTRAWIQYQSEQALYCALQEQVSFHCRARLEARLREFVLVGQFSTKLSGASNDWMVEVQWRFRGMQIHTRKRLEPGLIMATRALRY